MIPHPKFYTNVEHLVRPKDVMTPAFIGQFLRQARKAAGLKQSALSAQVGLKSDGYIPNVERGRTVPSLDMALKFEKALGLPKNSMASLVVKHRLQESSAGILQEAAERGIKVNVRLHFQD